MYLLESLKKLHTVEVVLNSFRQVTPAPSATQLPIAIGIPTYQVVIIE